VKEKSKGVKESKKAPQKSLVRGPGEGLLLPDSGDDQQDSTADG